MPNPSADLVIYATILTVDETRPTAEAIAVADGRIVAVGGPAEVGAQHQRCGHPHRAQRQGPRT